MSARAKSIRPDERPLGQSRDLHNDVEIGRPAPGVDAFERGDVGIVPTDADADILLGDLFVVRRVEVPPPAGPRLNPRVALTVDSLADRRLALRMQVARHVT